jgi:hypothetical protein
MSSSYRKDPFWASKKLTPGQLSIHDIGFEKRQYRDTRLELNAILPSSVIPEDGWEQSAKSQQEWQKQLDAIDDIKLARIEVKKLLETRRQYEWMSEFRLSEEEKHIHCRWV